MTHFAQHFSKVLHLLTVFILLFHCTHTLEAMEQTPSRQKIFIENRGQWPPEVLFQTSTPEGMAWITKTGIVHDVRTTYTAKDGKRRLRGHSFLLQFENAKTKFSVAGKQSAGVANYYIGDQSKWAEQVAMSREVHIAGVYEGIDLRYYYQGSNLRYDWIVHPGADISQLQMNFSGIPVDIEQNGLSLNIQTTLGVIRHAGLFAYQTVDGVREQVPCRFEKRGNGIVGFDVSARYSNLPLIIDPLIYSTYLGGAGSGPETLSDIAVEKKLTGTARAYVVGTTSSASFPAKFGSYDVSYNGGASDIFVIRFSPRGDRMEYCTFIGGNGEDVGKGIAIDRQDRATVVGSTVSTDFPRVGGSASSFAGVIDGFVSRLNAVGGQLEMSRYYGGPRADFFNAVSVDADGNAYAVGSGLEGYPVTTGVWKTTNPPVMNMGNPEYRTDGVATKFGISGIAVYSTFIGSTLSYEGAADVKVDQFGNAYIVGETAQIGFPVTPGAFGSVDPDLTGTDIFVVKLNANATAATYSAVVGGNSLEFTPKLDIDLGGNVYCAAGTASTNFPTVNAAYPSMTGGSDAVVFKLNSAGNALTYSTYFGGTDLYDLPADICVDVSTRATMLMTTTSPDIPVTGNAYKSNLSTSDFVLARFTPTGALNYCSYFGGGAAEAGAAIATDNRGNLYFGGSSNSMDYPLKDAVDITPENQEAVFTKFCIGFEPCTMQFDAGEDKQMCFGGSIQIGRLPTNTQSTLTFEWTPTLGLNSSTQAQPFYTPPQPGIFTLYVTAYDGDCCIAYDSISVTVLDVPKPIAGTDTTICLGTTVILGKEATGGTPPYSYSWNPTTGLDSPNTASTGAAPSVNTKYILSVTDLNGCTVRDTAWVFVNPRPKANVGSTKEICYGSEVSIGLPATGGTPPFLYSWTPTIGLSDASIASPNAAPLATTTYKMWVTDAKGCTAQDSVMITVLPKINLSLEDSVVVCNNTSIPLPASASGGTSTLRHQWEPPTNLNDRFAASPIYTAKNPGRFWYKLTVRDGKNCSAIDSILIIVQADPSISPGNAQINFGILSGCESSRIDSVLLTNNGNTEIIFAEIDSLTPGFQLLTGLPIIIPSGGKAFVKFRFSPTIEGATSGIARIKTNPCALQYTITFSGEKSGLFLRSEPVEFTFGSIPVCSTDNQRISGFVRNVGPEPITLRLDLARVPPPFLFTGGQSTELLQNAPLQINIDLTQGFAVGTYSQTLEIPFSTTQCVDTMRIPIKVVIAGGVVVFEPALFQAGEISGCNRNKDTVIVVSNNGNIPAVINTLTGSVMISSQDLPLTLAPGEKKNMRVSIVPTADGNFSFVAKAAFSPCMGSSEFTVTGRKSGISIMSPDTVNLPVLLLCQLPATSTQSFVIQNASSGGITATVVGVNVISGSFTTDITPGATIQSNQSLNGSLSIQVPALTNPTTIIGKLAITYDLCGIVDTIVVKQEIEDSRLIATTVISAPPIPDLQTLNLDWELRNNNAVQWNITSIATVGNKGTLIFPTGFSVPTQLLSGENVQCKYRISGALPSYRDTIIVETDSPCLSIIKIPVIIGDEFNQTAISIGSTAIDPGDLAILPISASNIPNQFLGLADTLKGTVVFKKSMLNDEFSQCTVAADEFCRYAIALPISLKNGVVASLRLYALLGDTTESLVRIEQASFAVSGINPQALPGVVSVNNTCLGPRRFFRVSPVSSIHSLSPNPASSHCTIEFSIEESGQCRIIAVDLLGNIVSELFSGELEQGSYRQEFSLDFQSGYYFLQLQTTNTTTSYPLEALR